jgi:hypothetical protein
VYPYYLEVAEFALYAYFQGGKISKQHNTKRNISPVAARHMKYANRLLCASFAKYMCLIYVVKAFRHAEVEETIR